MKKKILYFLSLFNTLSLVVIGILFVVFILQDIPLKYLIGLIVIYSITQTLALILGSWNTQRAPSQKYDSPPHRSNHFLPLFVANLILIALLELLIGRYQLDAYRWYIMSGGILWINGIFFEVFGGYISRWFRTRAGLWIVRTFLLIVSAGVIITLWNTFSHSPLPEIQKPPRHTSSEVTGTLSTIDPNSSSIETPIITWPLDIVNRSISLWDTGADIADLQHYLRNSGYYTGMISWVYDTDTASSFVRYIRENPVKDTSSWWSNEVTGTLTTHSWISIDSIESIDGGATARIENGQIIVEVLPQQSIPSTSTMWQIQSSITKIGWGWLQGVVISAPVSTPRAGSYTTYQSITLSAEWASGIFFTIDGSEPTCSGKWYTKLETPEKTFTLKAISCFGGNKIRGPISTHVFGVK